jgi:hypothetical protein
MQMLPRRPCSNQGRHQRRPNTRPSAISESSGDLQHTVVVTRVGAALSQANRTILSSAEFGKKQAYNCTVFSPFQISTLLISAEFGGRRKKNQRHNLEMSAAEIEALRAENEALAAEIKAMKAALGVDKVEQASERKRLQVRGCGRVEVMGGCLSVYPLCEEPLPRVLNDAIFLFCSSYRISALFLDHRNCSPCTMSMARVSLTRTSFKGWQRIVV